MRKKKSPFAWVVVVVILVGVVFVANAKSHDDPKADAQQAQLEQQQKAAQNAPAPTADTIQQKVKAAMKPGGTPGISSPKGHGGGPLANRVMLEVPNFNRGGKKAAPEKQNLSSQTLGQWYHDDSVKSVSN